MQGIDGLRLLGFIVGMLFAVVVQAADELPTVLFSHFYIDLDKETYHAFQESSQILSFADHELAHKNDGHSEYTGFYIKGRHTYMEFFGDPIPEGDRLGSAGLGLWVEKMGDVDIINKRLQKTFGDQAKISSTTYPIGISAVPWYKATYVDENRGDDILSAWIEEVDPGYLASRHPGSPIKEPLSREQYLSWEFKPDRLFDDVIGLTLDLPFQEASLLRKELAIIGWKVVNTSSGGYTANGPDIKLIVRAANTRGGVREADLRLRRSVKKQHFEIGSATLDLDGKFGHLIFYPVN